MTPRQRDAYGFIVGYVERHGMAPTVAEIMAGIGLRSKSEAHRLLDCLVNDGHVLRLPYRTRGLIVTGVCPHCKRPFEMEKAA